MSVRRIVGRMKTRVKQALRALSDAGPGRPPLPPTHWGLTADPDRGLLLEGVALQSLLQEWGSPLYVVDVAALERNATRFQSPASRCEVFYSYKTNPIPFVLARLHTLGIGAEVISAYELWLALRLGVAPDRIVYNGPVKSVASIRDAIERGVGLITANHAEELPVFASIAAAVGKRPCTGIRINTAQGWSGQFGVAVAGDGALRAFEEAKRHTALDLCALHAHRGGMIRTEGELSAFVSEVLAFTDVLAERLDLNLRILDFGGSLATPSVDHIRPLDRRLNQTLLRDLPAPDVHAALSIERYVSMLTEMVTDHYERRSRPRPRIFVEPGRSLTGNTQLLLATVHSLKQADDRVYAILDAGINVAEPVRNEYHQILPVNRIGEPSSRLYTVVGPICTPGDTLYPAVRLPELQPGDSVCVMDAGAYFVPFATSFSFPQPAIVAVDHGREFPVRRAEQFEDLIDRDTKGT
jgi:diaminopimelate decarboxylase